MQLKALCLQKSLSLPFAPFKILQKEHDTALKVSSFLN